MNDRKTHGNYCDVCGIGMPGHNKGGVCGKCAKIQIERACTRDRRTYTGRGTYSMMIDHDGDGKTRCHIEMEAGHGVYASIYEDDVWKQIDEHVAEIRRLLWG